MVEWCDPNEAKFYMNEDLKIEKNENIEKKEDKNEFEKIKMHNNEVLYIFF